MSLTSATIQTAFNEEAGAASSLTTPTEIERWWNEGQARLNRHFESSTSLVWAAGALEVALPADFVSISKLDYAPGQSWQDWRVFGRKLVLDDRNGATAASTGTTLYYWAERPDLTAGAPSIGTKQEDYACLYYALSRFYRKLASNRVVYTRYSTLLGANAVSVSDIQNEADRLLQDFIDARADLPPLQPAGYYSR